MRRSTRRACGPRRFRERRRRRKSRSAPNMTTLTFHLARGLAARWAKGDEVVVTELDHHAQRRAVDAPSPPSAASSIRTVRMDPATGALDWADLEQAITPRTKAPRRSAPRPTRSGTVTDVAAAARLAHAEGALVFVDAVHYAPHVLVDVKALGCDFLACSAYKFYGPHVGVLWGRRDLLASLDVPKLMPAPDAAAGTARDRHAESRGDRRRRGRGRLSWRRSATAPAATRAPASRHSRRCTSRATALLARMWNGLSAIPGVRMYGRPPGTPRTPTVAVHAGRHRLRRRRARAARRVACSSRTATSTRPRSSSDSAMRRTASSAQAARATRRPTRSIA